MGEDAFMILYYASQVFGLLKITPDTSFHAAYFYDWCFDQYTNTCMPHCFSDLPRCSICV